MTGETLGLLSNGAGDVLAPSIPMGPGRVLCGTCSWNDASLVKESGWYPRRSMKAAERMAFYASRFPVVEIDTNWFPPTPEVARQWAERTPAGFVIDVRAWSLLTGHPTIPHSLWADLQTEVRPELRDRPTLYDKHLSAAGLEEAWARYRHALGPLHRAGRLGAVVLPVPHWLGPRDCTRQALTRARERLADYRVAVELRNPRWLEGPACEETLSFLEDNGLAFVCTDETQGFPSSMPPVVAATAELSLVRFHGRNPAVWDERALVPAARHRYHYRLDELTEWVPRIEELAGSAGEIHVLMGNCFRDFAVTNAKDLAGLLASSPSVSERIGAGIRHDVPTL